MDNITRNNSQYLWGFYLLQFEALCHFNLTKQLVELFKADISQPKYGCESGFNTFIAMGYQLDASVFLYESTKHFALFSPTESKAFTEQTFYSDLETVRNNIHTYFKNGGFAEKASTIAAEKLKEYKLDKPDLFCMLRNDIALVFQIENYSRCLIGCDYFIYHCIYESDNKKWKGTDYRDYAAFLSSNIKGIASTVDETPYQLSKLHFVEQMPMVELFDFKSADLIGCSAVSQTVTFRLLLMLYQISYILILAEKIFDYKTITKNDLWTCFFGKLMAIKYDESFDNLQSLMKFSEDDDKKQLAKYCETENLLFDNLHSRKFAQKLRNTIHYQELHFDISKIEDNSTKNIVKGIYLSNTGTNNMDEFRNNTAMMVKEMKLLQKVIRKIISVDKDFSY